VTHKGVCSPRVSALSLALIHPSAWKGASPKLGGKKKGRSSAKGSSKKFGVDGELAHRSSGLGRRLVGEEDAHEYRHGNDQQRDRQVGQAPGALRRAARGEGPGRDEAEPGDGVQRVAIDDRGERRDEPQRRGDLHEELVALHAGPSGSAHRLTFRMACRDEVSIPSSAPALLPYPPRLREGRSSEVLDQVPPGRLFPADRIVDGIPGVLQLVS
jgi:hypothetical protein